MDIGSGGFGLSAGVRDARAAQRMLYEAWPWHIEEGGEVWQIPVEVRVRVAPWWVRAVEEASGRLEAGEDEGEVEEWLINVVEPSEATGAE